MFSITQAENASTGHNITTKLNVKLMKDPGKNSPITLKKHRSSRRKQSVKKLVGNTFGEFLTEVIKKNAWLG